MSTRLFLVRKVETSWADQPRLHGQSDPDLYRSPGGGPGGCAGRPPGGETLEEARARASPALVALHRRHPDETVVLVTHSIVGRIVIADCLGTGLSVVAHLKLKTASISVLRLDASGGVLERLGNVSHLEKIPASEKPSSAGTERLEDQNNFRGIQEGEEPRWQTSVSSAARATSV